MKAYLLQIVKRLEDDESITKVDILDMLKINIENEEYELDSILSEYSEVIDMEFKDEWL